MSGINQIAIDQFKPVGLRGRSGGITAARHAGGPKGAARLELVSRISEIKDNPTVAGCLQVSIQHVSEQPVAGDDDVELNVLGCRVYIIVRDKPL